MVENTRPVVATIRQHVRKRQPTVDSSGEAVRAQCCRCCIRFAASAVDGGDRLQCSVRWFVRLNLDEEVWTHRVTKTRTVLEAGGRRVSSPSGGASTEPRADFEQHFTVDETLLEAWAGAKSFQRKNRKTPPPDDPGNPTVNFHGEIGAMRRMHRRPMPMPN